MADWERIVAERLAGIKLTDEQRREVVAEIAGHLEEAHEELLRAGSPDPAGQTLGQVSDWRALRRNIPRAMEDRMSFARKVVLPGVIAVMLAIAALKLAVYFLITPQLCEAPIVGASGLITDSGLCIQVSADGPAYLPWLATLPLAGALAAGLARRFGARPAQRLAAAISPAFYLLVDTLVAGLHSEFYWRIPIYWVVIPAVACALGAWPFLRGRSDSDSIDTNTVVTAGS
jgi:hypothetical protein